jgi:hypothetical protein
LTGGGVGQLVGEWGSNMGMQDHDNGSYADVW